MKSRRVLDCAQSSGALATSAMKRKAAQKFSPRIGLPSYLVADVRLMSHWIYTDTIEGDVPAARLTLAYERGTNNTQEALRGSVTFSKCTMRVDLRLPVFNDNGS